MEKTYNSTIMQMIELSNTTRMDTSRGAFSTSGGWMNTLTGLGMLGRDKRISTEIVYQPLTEIEVEELFAQDDIAGRVVTVMPDLGTCAWIDLEVSDEEGGKEMQEKLEDEADRIGMKEAYRKAWEWARLYGGAGVFISVDDGKELFEPLVPEDVRSIKNFTVLSRYELHRGDIDFDLTSDNFLMPIWYWLGPRSSDGKNSSKPIHHTRIIRFDGVELPRRIHQQNNYWSDSVLTRLFNVLRNFNLAHDATCSIIQDFRLGVLKIKNLADLVASGETNALKKRIETMNLSKSVLGTLLLDSEDESFDQLHTSVQGVEKVLDKVNKRLTSATGLPHTIVHGEGATGFLSGSGDAEDRQLVKFVQAEQDKKLTKPIDRGFEIIQAAQQGPTNGKQLESFSWDYADLVEKTLEQTIDNRNKQSTIDTNDINNGVLSADEVRTSRYGGREYSHETQLLDENQDRQDQADDHGHGDPLSGYTGGAVNGQGAPMDPLDINHLHQRPNGLFTEAAIFLPSGAHFHPAGTPTGKGELTEHNTGLALSLEAIEEMEAIVAENEGRKVPDPKPEPKEDPEEGEENE